MKTELPTFEALDLPPILGQLAMERQGLILVVGATGSGKSTTTAAMLDYRNAHAPGHIVTVEDPVEFIHTRKQSVISHSLLLRAVIAQRLVPRAEGKGRIAAMEIMLNTPRLQAIIRRGELETIRLAIEEGGPRGPPDARPGAVRALPREEDHCGGRPPVRGQPEQHAAPDKRDQVGTQTESQG